MKLVSNYLPEDKSDLLSGVSFAKEERILSSFVGNKFSGLIDHLIQFGLNKSAVFELEDGTKYDNVTATIDIGEGKERTLNLHKYDNMSILEYVPNQYEKDNGHADESTIIQYLCLRATEYIEKMDASELWGLNESTLRKAVSYGKLVNGVDVCKFGKQWVCIGRCYETCLQRG